MLRHAESNSLLGARLSQEQGLLYRTSGLRRAKLLPAKFVRKP